MKVLIKSRKEIEKIAKIPFPRRTLVISITDVGEAPVELINKPAFLLRVAFDDVDNDVIADEVGANATAEEKYAVEKKYNMISYEQAREIAEICYNHRNDVNVLICQCEHGRSRSAAVAAAILEFRDGRGIGVFSNNKYYPNKVVFRRVLDALRDQIPVY